MNRTVGVRRWAVIGVPVILVIGGAWVLLFCGGRAPKAAWALLFFVPTALWWAAGAASLQRVRPIWDAGSSRRIALADRWLFGGLCASVVAGPGLALLIAIYARLIDFPGVLPALAIICVSLAQFLGNLAFGSGRLRLFRRWPGRFR